MTARLSLLLRRDEWRLRTIGMSVAAVLCGAYAVYQPQSIDLASGSFRARLFGQGAYVWNNRWFGGHPLPGYGVVSPALNSWFGPRPVAVASVLVGTWCFALLIERWCATSGDVRTAQLSVLLFAFGSAANLWAGRMTFAPSIAFGVACLLMLVSGRQLWAIVFAALCGLSSPVGALSLAIVLGAIWMSDARNRRITFFTALAALVPMGVLIVLFPEGGWYPFTGGSFALLSIALAVIGWYGRDIKVLRWAVLLYWSVAIVAYLVRSPLGGNVARLGWVAAGAAGAFAIRRHRTHQRVLLVAFTVFTLIWSWSYVSMAFQKSSPTADPKYYTPLSDYLGSLPGEFRVEVVPTPTYLQADVLAETIDIARGWQTQVDRGLNPQFYGGNLTTDSFHQWLRANAVEFVALPLQGVHDKSRDEAAIVAAAPAFLHLVWSNAGWKVYRVLDALPLADNGATVAKVEPESITVRVPNTGPTVVRYRYTDLYKVSSGAACISATPEGWIQLDVRRPGTVRLDVSVLKELDIVSDPGCP